MVSGGETSRHHGHSRIVFYDTNGALTHFFLIFGATVIESVHVAMCILYCILHIRMPIRCAVLVRILVSEGHSWALRCAKVAKIGRRSSCRIKPLRLVSLAAVESS